MPDYLQPIAAATEGLNRFLAEALADGKLSPQTAGQVGERVQDLVDAYDEMLGAAAAAVAQQGGCLEIAAEIMQAQNRVLGTIARAANYESN